MNATTRYNATALLFAASNAEMDPKQFMVTVEWRPISETREVRQVEGWKTQGRTVAVEMLQGNGAVPDG